jgi:4-hydroxyproline epimerase
MTPATEGTVRIDAPAGLVTATYVRNGAHVDSVRIRNVPSFLAFSDVTVEIEGLGELVVDVAYGGNFYAIIEPQKNYAGIDALGPDGIIRLSPLLRRAVNRAVAAVHPLDPTIAGVSHIQWTDRARDRRAHGRNAVYYGDKAIDRSPCGTGTSARMAQLAAKGKLAVGQDFIHESIIGTLFEGRVEAASEVGNLGAIVPSIAGWARLHAINTIFVDSRDPLAGGFQLA